MIAQFRSEPNTFFFIRAVGFQAIVCKIFVSRNLPSHAFQLRISLVDSFQAAMVCGCQSTLRILVRMGLQAKLSANLFQLLQVAHRLLLQPEKLQSFIPTLAPWIRGLARKWHRLRSSQARHCQPTNKQVNQTIQQEKRTHPQKNKHPRTKPNNRIIFRCWLAGRCKMVVYVRIVLVQLVFRFPYRK